MTQVLGVLQHEVIEFLEDVVALLPKLESMELVSKDVVTTSDARSPTLAVVFDQDLNALPAASIAARVSSMPRSGTVPSTSVVAGSIKGP